MRPQILRTSDQSFATVLFKRNVSPKCLTLYYQQKIHDEVYQNILLYIMNTLILLDETLLSKCLRWLQMYIDLRPLLPPQINLKDANAHFPLNSVESHMCINKKENRIVYGIYTRQIALSL